MVDIIGRAKVIAETVVDERQAQKAGEKAGKKAGEGVAKGGKEGGTKFSQGFETVVGKSLPLAAVGVGAAVGVVLAAQIGKSIERETEGARLSASLGLGAEGTAEINSAAAKIYREAWGASFADVQRGVAATKSSFQDLTGEELVQASRNAQVFADVFAVDVVQAAGAASVAVKQGLAKDAVEAFDLLTAASQQVPMQFRDELLEAATEYSQFFKQIGIEGPEAFGLLVEGAALGQYGIDKTGDAIKEFGIRAIDASATTVAAFDTLGLDMQQLQADIAAGGDEAEEAFRSIVFAIDDLEDPTMKAQTAIALFGAPIEDLGNEQIPVFIEALANGTLGLQNFEGATQTAGDTAGGTFSSKATAFARSLDVIIGDAIDGAIEKLSDFTDWLVKVTGGLDDLNNAPTVDLGDKVTYGNSDFVDQITGGSAGGGPVPRGLRLVGENGPELAAFGSGGGYVYNNSQTREIVADASGGTNITNYNLYGPESLSQARRDNDWDQKYGTRFGSATSAAAL